MVNLRIATKKTDSPVNRRGVALRAIAQLSMTEATIWSGASARGGGAIRNGGTGAIIQLRRLDRGVELSAAV